MSGWRFKDVNPIANFTVTAELSAPILPAVVRQIAGKHALFRRDLPRRQEQPMLMFPMPGQPIVQHPPQIGGVIFDFVVPDGSVAKSLTIAPNQITYMTTAYTRWPEFQPLYERLFTDLFKLLPTPTPIAALMLAVTNRFAWEGERAQATLAGVLNPECDLFAPHILERSDHCHSFHGFLEKRGIQPFGHYIRNVNIQTGELEGAKIATLSLSHRLVLDDPPIAGIGFFSGGKPKAAIGSRIMKELHDSNNKIFVQVINPSITRMLPGLD